MPSPFALPFRRTALATACLCAVLNPALAADVVTVTAPRIASTAYVPATTESVTSEQLAESVNTVTTAGALQYLPSTHVRERYIGDRNGILVMRVNGSTSSAQTTVYAGGLLLSNFLNNSFSTAPRWGMVSPEEIERIDTLYGSYSALYPGNSAGGVVRITTRMPTRFEAHVKLDAFTQRFELYGTNQDFGGGHASVSLGHAVGDWSGWVALDHLDNKGQLQTFGNTTAKTGAPAAAGTFVDVSGSTVIRDIDTSGRPRIIVSSTGIDHTVQDIAKIKLGYRVSSAVKLSYSLGLWQNSSEGTVDSYLRDATGRTVHSAGAAFSNPSKFVRIDGVDYTVSNAVPSRAKSEHWLHGLSLKTHTSGAWDGEAIVSVYDQKQDHVRTATPTSGFDSGLDAVRPGGQFTDASGTGWQSIDLRGTWRSEGKVASARRLSFGAHHDRYELRSVTYGTAASPVVDWLTGVTGALNTNSFGNTETQALYLQDKWRLAPGWMLAAGGRFERWRAFGGSNYNVAKVAPTPLNVVFEDRSRSDFSPKFHVAWQATPELAFRGSLGKAVRYPTVAEMFQLFNGPGSIRTNDPNLKPGQANSAEAVVQRSTELGTLRGSLFYEDKRDALISQDGGRTFSAPFTVHQDRQLITHRFESVAVDARGTLHTVWVDKRDLELQLKAAPATAAAAADPAASGARRAKPQVDYRGAALYRNESTDGGQTFGPDIKLADHSCECCRIALSPAPDGSLVALWRHVFAPNQRDHAFASLSTGGPVEPIRATFDRWAIDACPHHGPGLAPAAGGGYHAVWYGVRAGDGRVRYGRLAADGSPAGEALPLPDERAEHAMVQSAGSRVAIVWRSFDGEATRWRAWLSADDGRQFALRELGRSADDNDHPLLALKGSDIFALWRTQKGVQVERLVP